MNDNDLITRREVELVLLEKGQRSRRYRIGEIWELNFDEIREALQECQPKLVRCNGCKYLNTPANGVPFCKRIKKFVDADWFCADGEKGVNVMTYEERNRELTRSSFATQMAMLGYKPDGTPKDMVEVIRCKDCTYRGEINCPQYYRRTELSDNYFCADGARQESVEDVTGLYCDDITFCWGPCDMFKCPRNRYNIRDKRVPHSFFAEGVVPDDCPKK